MMNNELQTLERQETVSSEPRMAWLEKTLPPRVRKISERVKIIRFGVIKEGRQSPWAGLAGMFRAGSPVNVEELLEARGFDQKELARASEI
jgi:hypothetical protein